MQSTVCTRYKLYIVSGCTCTTPHCWARTSVCGLSLYIGFKFFQLLQQTTAINNPAKCILFVHLGSCLKSDVELWTVNVGILDCHTKDSTNTMLQSKALIFKCVSINTWPTSSTSSMYIPSLNPPTGNYSLYNCFTVAQENTSTSFSFTSAESAQSLAIRKRTSA